MNILEHETEGKFYHEYNNSSTTSSNVSSSSSSASSSGGSRSTQDEDNLLHSEAISKQDYVLLTPPSPRMEGGGGRGNGGGNTNSDPTTIKTENSLEAFSCESCGNTSYRNTGEFGTIKLGDIFSNLEDDGARNKQNDDEGPPQQRLCAQCLDSHNSTNSHFIAGADNDTNSSTAHHNSIKNSSGTNLSGSINSNSSSSNIITNSPDVTNCLPKTDGHVVSRNEEKATATTPDHLLQGVPTPIIMQNAANLQSEIMHNDHQQHFYHQDQQHILQQVKLESEAMGHSQLSSHNSLDNFMLIHDGGAMYSDNNELISFERQQQQQAISGVNQSASNTPAVSGIQQIAVATQESDIKYTIPTSSIVQMQGNDQSQAGDHVIQYPSAGENHLISLGGGNVISGSSGDISRDVVTSVPSTAASTTFQFLDLVALNKASSILFTTSGTTVVTNTEASIASSIMTIPTITPTATSIPPPPPITIATTNKKNKAPKKEKNSSASGSGGAKSKNNNNNNPTTTDKKNNAQKGQGKEQAEKTPCDLCKKKFKNPKMAMNHYRRVHQKEANFVCETCGAVFSLRGSLDAHLVIHKKPETTAHDCGKCGMQFSAKSILKQHMRIHSDNPKKFPCDWCPSGFSKRVNLRYHIKRKHPEEAEKMSNNNNSNKDSTTGGSGGPVGSHFLQPSGPITATNSSANPPGAGGGSDTSKDNKNQGNFKCEHCDRAFLFKNNLKAHLRTHTRDKKYTCELCTKSFIYKESLKNHMLLHSNELPYLCEVCGKKFRDRSNRRKHVKNVHKYLFVNGDINNPVKPGAALPTAASTVSSQGGTSTSQPGEPPTKKRKNSKKAATQQPTESIDETGQDGISKSRSTTKSPGAPRGKKAKTVAAAAGSSQSKSTNMKSVIVSSAPTGTATVVVGGLDRKIIMSPSPKNPKSHSSSGISSGSVSSPNSLEYVHSHPSSLPVTVHVPLAGSQGQYSHGRNIIVKASATSGTVMPPNHHQSPPALSPEMYHHPHSQQQHHQQQHHSRGVAGSLQQQNVIVYPKTKVIPDHSQQYPSSASSVISQTMQQQAQYYSMNPSPEQQQQHHHHHHHQNPYVPYVQLSSQQPSSVQSSLMHHPHPIPSPNQPGLEYVFGSTNHLSSQNPQDQRVNDPYGPAGGVHGGSSQPMEIQVVNPEYSHQLYAAPDLYEQHQQYHQWAAATAGPPPGMDGGHQHPPNSSSPYQQLVVAPPVGSSGSSSSILVNEGPPGSHQQHPSPVSLAQSYHHDSSGGLNPNSNALSPAAVYASGAPQGHEVLDPSGNGGNFFYKDFDFSYL